jgi:tRNA (guanine37-N1)-methyltransferase
LAGKTENCIILGYMRFDIITIFPEVFGPYFDSSIIGRARRKKLITIRIHNLRRFATDRHKSVDDRPYGGGVGMVLKIEPIYKAVSSILRSSKSEIRISKQKQKSKDQKRKTRIILFSAKGKVMTQSDVRRWAKFKHLILICGHYEGVDERVARYIADEEISIGEYVLTGGELPAMVLVDAVSRLIPGVLGKSRSLAEESFSRPGYREYPQYTRPEVFEIRHPKFGIRKLRVPKVLLSGNHKKIEEWRRKHAQYKI